MDEGLQRPSDPRQPRSRRRSQGRLPWARNVLVLNPGTSASSAYFKPIADDIVRLTHGRWQVWAVERRENQLEDHSLLNASSAARRVPRKLFDYYLGWLTDPSITNHFELIPDAEVAYGRGWGMNVEIQDLNRVVESASRVWAPGRARRPLARRHDHHRLRDLGLQGQAGSQGPRRPRLHRRRQQPRAGHPGAGEQSLQTCRRAPPGSASAASPPRSPVSSRRPAPARDL